MLRKRCKLDGRLAIPHLLAFALAMWAALFFLLNSTVSATPTPGRIPGQTVSAGISTTYTISGRVHDAQSPDQPGVAGATIYAGNHYSATTDSNGVYTITGVPSGTYTLSGVLAGLNSCNVPQFTPSTRTVHVPPDAGNQDFSVAILILDPSIFGIVTDANGAAIAGVTVSANGLPPVLTGADGGFGWFPVECDHTYTLTPAKAGYTFAPPVVTLTTPQSIDLHFVGADRFQHRFLPIITTSDQDRR